MKLGYFAAHEQRSPLELLENCLLAEKQGFQTVWSSDHFHPWFDTGAHGGFAWCWLAALAERTKRVTIGTGVTAVLRYHPAVIAQAFATLSVLYPGRIFLGLGTGEAMNEAPLGFEWPAFNERLQRLEEAVQIVRALWEHDWVTYHGKYFRVTDARLYTKPTGRIPIYIAACGPKTALLAGKYADGLLTLPMAQRNYNEVLFPALMKGAALSSKKFDSIERVLEMEVSYDPDYEKALHACSVWAGTKVPNCVNVSDPRLLESEGRQISAEKLTETWFVFTDPDSIINRIETYSKLGFSHIQFLSSSPDEKKFIQMMGSKVLPSFHADSDRS